MDEYLILFVCTGNICRSPMAEYLLRDRLGAHAAWRVASAGTSAIDGMAPSRAAVAAMAERGIDLTPHRSRPLERDQVDAAELIVVMTAAHREQIHAAFPGNEEKVSLLKSFDPDAVGEDVPDPIGMPLDVYRFVAAEINAALPGLVAYMKALKPRSL